MNRSIQVTILIAMLILACGTLAFSQTPPGAKGGLIAPPAIYLPFGANIVTELNFADEDVLGVLKQIIPMIGEFAELGMRAGAAKGAPINPEAVSKVVSAMDFKALSEAVAGVKNVRVLVATYKPGLSSAAVLKQLEAGVIKVGTFRKIASDIAMLPGPCAIYAEADNNGYLAFAYEPKGGVLYAGRLVGSVDVPKIIKWAGELGKAFMGSMAAPVGQGDTPVVGEQPQVVPEQEVKPQ